MRWIKATKSHQVAGFGIMSYGKLKANLNLLAVRPEYRSRGIGQKILQILEERAFDEGLQDFYVQVRESNTAAQRFYQRYGYEMIDRNARYYKNQEAAVILYKYRPGGKP